MLLSRSTCAGFSSATAGSNSTSAPALRLYRSLMRARRQFPVDEKRAASGRDMRSLLHSRIRNAFEQSRSASGAQASKLLQTGEEELHALRIISTNHFASEVRRFVPPSLPPSLSRPLARSLRTSVAPFLPTPPSLATIASMRVRTLTAVLAATSTPRRWATTELRLRMRVPEWASRFSASSGRAEPANYMVVLVVSRPNAHALQLYRRTPAFPSRVLLEMGSAAPCARRCVAALRPPTARHPFVIRA